MTKKRFSYVGLSVIVTILISTPVFSDAPSHLIEQQLRQKRGDSSSGSNSFRDGDSDEAGSTNTTSDRLQGGNNSSSGSNSSRGGDSNSGGASTTSSDRFQESDDSSSGSNSSRDGDSNSGGASNTSSDRFQESDDSSSGDNGLAEEDPKEAGSSGGVGGIINTAPIPGGNNSSSSEQKNNSGGFISTPGEKTQGSDNNKSANVLDAFARNPFIPWFLLLLLLGLLGAFLWWFRRYRLVTEGDLEDRINSEVSRRLEQQVNQYVDQVFEQKINNNIGLIISNLLNQPEINRYIGQCVDSEINHTFEQKIQNYAHIITQNLVNNNDGLNQYIDQRLQHAVINNNRINNEIVDFVANSPAINNKINQFYRDIDLKVENIRSEWNRTFINLLRQYVDELIDMMSKKETFNMMMANAIAIKVDELHNQIAATKNDLTLLINDADRHLYEWTLGELMAIKGCLTDRQALVEQLAFFSAKLSNELNHNPCVDINTFKPFKLIPVNSTSLSPVQSRSLSES